ncbi:MAG: diguanylate cyclase [Chitinivibrionales bacterium]|nr:diguanylate cyclase [Chitinivibrionales bacterium]
MTPHQNNDFQFDGYRELICEPLQNSDIISFKRIQKVISDSPQQLQTPFSLLLQRICGKSMPEDIARRKWRQILNHKNDMENKLQRNVGIQTAAVDFFDIAVRSQAAQLFSVSNGHAEKDDLVEQISAPGFYLEKLKEELRRSRRYKHALSAILINVDHFKEIVPDASNRVLTGLVKIIKKAIRTVDILARYSEDKFVVILPNTNKREALELAERLCKDIQGRTERMAGIDGGISVTSSVGQCELEDSSVDFMRRLDNALARGRSGACNGVYAL